MGSSALSLALALALGAPAPHEDSPYTSALTELAAADEAASRHPERSTTELLSALVTLTQFPASVSGDPHARELQSLAQLNLARAHLLRGEPELAGAIVDEAIRTAHGRELPAAVFGPDLAAFYDQRLAALESAGRARLRVSCTVPCRVYVDERETTLLSEPLYLGPYRVWVTDQSGARPPLHQPVMLAELGEVVELSYQPVPPSPGPQDALARSSLTQGAEPRALPRGLELTTALLGAGLSGAGIGLIAAGDLQIPGGVMIGVGALSFFFGGVMLIIDERRESKADDVARTVD